MTSAWRSTRRFARRALAACIVLGGLGLGAAVAAAALPGSPAEATPGAGRAAAPDAPLPSAHPQAVEPEAGVAADEPDDTTSQRSSAADAGAPDDAQIRRELSELKALSSRAELPVGAKGRVLADGRAVAPRDAPVIVRDVIRAGNVIAKTPYLWGGGHGSWSSVGYDCSGSVSFALAGAGLLDAPLASGDLARWGASGPGRWITIYANAGHVFMVVAGLRFDTGALSGSGTRWQPTGRSTAGFAARHPEGL
jgi:cell wall-associated NlpC family hydrolase